MSIKKCLLAVVVVNLCAYSFGCANHVKVDTIVEANVVRTKLSHTIDIETNTGSLVTSPVINASVQENKAFKVATYELKTDYDVVTPYQGARELYEFPVGVAALPVAVVVNMTDFLLFGLVPNKFTDSLLDWSFAGVNPFLNIESEERTERTVLKSDKKLLDEKEEHIKKPLFNQEIIVVAGDDDRMKITLDQNGKAEISLIKLSSVSNNIDRIKILAQAEDVFGEKEIDVSRQLRNQLEQASVITKKYTTLVFNEANPQDVEKVDLTVLSRDLMSLSKLGFEADSLRIEKKAMSLMSETKKKTFKAEIDKALAPDAPAVTLTTEKTADSN